MKGLSASKEILKDFDISSQNAIQPLPPIEKNVKPEGCPDQYWPISPKKKDKKDEVQKRTFEEKIREEIDGIVNTKIKDENQTSPRKLEPLPPFNLHISENISIGPGQVRCVKLVYLSIICSYQMSLKYLSRQWRTPLLLTQRKTLWLPTRKYTRLSLPNRGRCREKRNRLHCSKNFVLKLRFWNLESIKIFFLRFKILQKFISIIYGLI